MVVFKLDDKSIKNILYFVRQVILITILIITVSIVRDGMYLFGIPAIDNIQKVTISHSELSQELGDIGDIKEVTDLRNIELAVKLTGFLKYSLFEKADKYSTPLITITYYLKNNQQVDISANHETVWWKGKAHKIKEEDMFINLAEAIYFFGAVVEIDEMDEIDS